MTNFSKNSFYLPPKPLRLGEFLTNYCSIKGLKYHISVLHHTETFTIESKGDAKMLIKCDRLNINKLITDLEMTNAIKRVMNAK